MVAPRNMKIDLFRTKITDYSSDKSELSRCLSAFDLVLLGIGAIIGAGIFVLTGIAAATTAGPAVVLSYAIAGLACSFAALSYAELSASIKGAGSAYSYAYASLGEIVAWVIGWVLLLEYGIGACVVAIGWSGYVNDIFLSLGFTIPPYLLKSFAEGGWVNLPAIVIIWVLTAVLAIGAKQSARFTALIVFIKLAVIAIFIKTALPEVSVDRWHPFTPFGWNGIIEGAALVFFAFIGFDAVSTAAEEAKNPQKDLSIGIMGSLGICTLIYIIVSGLLTGIVSYTTLNSESPVADAVLSLGYRLTAEIISFGAVAGLTSGVLIFMYGLSRILYSMAGDGLLPKGYAQINTHTKTPIRIIVINGFILSIIAGFSPIKEVAQLVNIGTLAAFMMVCLCVIVLRKTKPNLDRPFKTPWCPLIPILGVLSCGYLMLHLPGTTWIGFIIWMLIGLLVYFCYGASNSHLGHNKPQKPL